VSGVPAAEASSVRDVRHESVTNMAVVEVASVSVPECAQGETWPVTHQKLGQQSLDPERSHDYLGTQNRRTVTAPDRVLLTGSRSTLARPGEEKGMPSPSSTGRT
jgi:hypothetical protein